jgi:Domain of unknown function (DUF3859)
MRWSLFAVMFALMSSQAAAQVPAVEAIRIIDFGTYAIRRGGQVTSERTPTGHLTWVEDYAITTRTDRICMRLGESFGVEYEVAGAPAATSVTIDFVTRLPPKGITDPKGRTFKESVYSSQKVVGERSFRSYTFDETWEMVAGTWVFEFYHQGRSLGEQRFDVVDCRATS